MLVVGPFWLHRFAHGHCIQLDLSATVSRHRMVVDFCVLVC
jgi:hypothetical protein